MADKDDNVEMMETGDEGKLVDENNNESVDRPQSVGSNRPQSVGFVGEKESGDDEEDREDTADLDEEQEYDGEEGEDDGDDEENNDIVYTNVEDTQNKQSFLQKLKYKLGIRPKIYDNSTEKDSVDSGSTLTIKYVPPPAPHNMPSARDVAKAKIYRREKVRYGQEKMEYYLGAMRDGTLMIDDLVMKSELNVSYVQGV